MADVARAERTAAVDAQRRKSMVEAIFRGQVIPTVDRVLIEVGITDCERKQNAVSLNLFVRSGHFSGVTLTARVLHELETTEIFIYNRTMDIQTVLQVKSRDEAYDAICQGFVKVLNRTVAVVPSHLTMAA